MPTLDEMLETADLACPKTRLVVADRAEDEERHEDAHLLRSVFGFWRCGVCLGSLKLDAFRMNVRTCPACIRGGYLIQMVVSRKLIDGNTISMAADKQKGSSLAYRYVFHRPQADPHVQFIVPRRMVVTTFDALERRRKPAVMVCYGLMGGNGGALGETNVTMVVDPDLESATLRWFMPGRQDGYGIGPLDLDREETVRLVHGMRLVKDTWRRKKK